MSLSRDIRLVGKVVAGKVPARALKYELLATLHRTLRTGNRRYEFERVHLENGDHWGYFTSDYERAKYRRTLARALELRRAGGSALEIGCSVGAFTEMLAKEFAQITALEISAEAIELARNHLKDTGNIAFVQGDILSLDLPRTFDVIFCGEVLYYLRHQDAAQLCRVLDRHLAPGGIVVMVSVTTTTSGARYDHGWGEILGERFAELARDDVRDVSRPYEIVTFARMSYPRPYPDYANDPDVRLLAAAAAGDVPALQRALDAGAAIDFVGESPTPDSFVTTALILATWNRQMEALRFLLGKGAAVDLQADGFAALNLANDAGVVRLLLDRGADPDIPDGNGDTALMSAAEKGDVEIVKLLVDAGADISVSRGNGWTALKLAQASEPELHGSSPDAAKEIVAILSASRKN